MTPKARDRNAEGRAEQQRPRDSLGRPVAYGEKGDPSASIEPTGTAEELLAMGVEHFNAGRYFQAHECWETAWHPSEKPERDFWQGITQIAVGYTHRQRGNIKGAKSLLERGIERTQSYGESYRGLNLGELLAAAIADHASLEQDESADVSPAVLTLS